MEIQRLIDLGILNEGFNNDCNSVLLVAYKNSNLWCIITDLCYLNHRASELNLVYPLIKDTFMIMGTSNCETLSLFGLKDAYHSLYLTETSK